MTIAIAQAGEKITDVTIISGTNSNVTPIDPAPTEVTPLPDDDAAEVEISKHGRAHRRHRHDDEHHGRKHVDGSVKEIFKSLYSVTSELSQLQAKIDSGALSGDSLTEAQAKAESLTEKFQTITNSSEFQKAKEFANAVLEAYKSDGKDAALAIAKENRDILGDKLIKLLKHDKIKRLENVVAAFNVLSPNVPTPPVSTDTPISDTVPADTAAETTTLDQAVEPAPVTLDASALSKAIAVALRGLGRSFGHHEHDHHDNGLHLGINRRQPTPDVSPPLFSPVDAAQLVQQIKSSPDLASISHATLDPLKSLELLSA